MADTKNGSSQDVEKVQAGEPVEEHVTTEQMDSLAAKLEAAEAQVSEYLDGWQRARAEFVNYKRRVEAEREDMRIRSKEDILRKLLPIVDDFERAFQTVPAELENAPWVNGISMIQNKLMALLTQEGVVAIETIGKPFDPRIHEAVLREDSTDLPDETVKTELRRGYLLGDRVLRAAQVAVANNPSLQSPTDAEPESES